MPTAAPMITIRVLRGKAVLRLLSSRPLAPGMPKEVEGKFHGPVAAELLGAYLAFREVERAIMEDAPVLRYKIGIDNSMVRAWCDGEAPIKNGLRYAVFIELVVTLLERIKNELASRNGRGCCRLPRAEEDQQGPQACQEDVARPPSQGLPGCEHH